jgi:hypothetical protein
LCRPTLEVLEERRLLATNLFGVGGDGRLYEQRLDNNGHASTAWFPTSYAGQIISDVSMSYDAHYGKMHLFGVGGDGRVYEQDQVAYGFTDWYSTSATGQIVSSVSVSVDGGHLFGVGGDRRVYEQDLDPDGHAITGWFPTSASGAIVSNVTVSGSHLFGLGTGGQVYEQTLDASGHAVGTWSLIDSNGSLTSDVSVSPDGRFAFGVGRDQRVYEHALDAAGNGVGAWNVTDSFGTIHSNITVGSDAYGNIHLFGVGGDGQVYEQDLNGQGIALSAWNSTSPGGITSNVNLTSDAYGNMHLFGVGTDGRVYEQDLDAGLHATTGWFATSSSGKIYSDVSAGGSPVVASSGVSVLGSLTLTWEPSATTAYSPANGTLFGVDAAGNSMPPSYLDVRQGGLGDCWLLASLAEVAARAPQDITSMFSYAGTTNVDGYQVSLYNVRFYDSLGVAHTVTVDTELPQGGSSYARPVGGSRAVNGSTSPVLWVALAEKAYAQANGQGFVSSSNVGSDSYSALNGGWPAWALQAITGNQATWSSGIQINSVGNLTAASYTIGPDATASAWNAGDLVVLCTFAPSSPYIVPTHCYALVNYSPPGYDPFNVSTPFELYNPWGTDANGWAPGNSGTKYGLFWASAGFLMQNFTSQSFVADSAQGGHDGDHGTVNGTGVLFSAPAAFLSQNFCSQDPVADTAQGQRDEYHASRSQQVADLAFIESLVEARLKARSRDSAADLLDFISL